MQQNSAFTPQSQSTQSQPAQSQSMPGAGFTDTPPQTEAWVDEDVLALRSPLVNVRRDDAGTWSFDGPGQQPRPSVQTLLGAVFDAWPHAAALSEMQPGSSAVWSWDSHGWASEFACHCGNCEQPKAADLDRRTWPSELNPERLVNVEHAALAGQVTLSDIIAMPEGIAMLGQESQQRPRGEMETVAMANVVRRWPHTMLALRAVRDGHGLRWNPEGLNWHEYATA